MAQKTILITLANRAVFRNLFFFPKSMWSEFESFLQKNSEYRVVLLIIKKDLEHFTDFFKNRGLGKYVFLETVEVKPPKNRREKLFYFFYSYLIYTGTTKLLATMGMRPDEPPAGGNRYLASIKWFIANTFGKFDAVKLKLVPLLFHRVFKNRPFTSVIEKYHPDLIFIGHIYGWFDQHVLAEAKRQGIETLGMPAGWDHLDKYYLPFHVDTLIAQSEEIKNAAVKHQRYDEKNIRITGYPHFDFIANSDIAASREKTLEMLGFPKNAQYLVYVSGSAYCPDEPDIIETMIKWADEGLFPNLHFVIRPYIGGRSKDREFDQDKFNQFAKHPRVYFFNRELWNDIPNSVDFINILRHTDMLLGMYTTIALEAAVLDRPLLAAAFDGYTVRPMYRSIRRFEQFEHFQDVLRTGALPTAYNFDKLKQLIGDYLKNPELYASERKVLRDKLCHTIDGLSSHRVLEEILKAVSVKS